MHEGIVIRTPPGEVVVACDDGRERTYQAPAVERGVRVRCTRSTGAGLTIDTVAPLHLIDPRVGA